MRDEASRPVRRHKWLRRHYATLRALVTTSHRGFSIFDWCQRSDRATTPLLFGTSIKLQRIAGHWGSLLPPRSLHVVTMKEIASNLICYLFAQSEQFSTDAHWILIAYVLVNNERWPHL